MQKCHVLPAQNILAVATLQGEDMYYYGCWSPQKKGHHLFDTPTLKRRKAGRVRCLALKRGYLDRFSKKFLNALSTSFKACCKLSVGAS
jgi:hypothetical protein